MKMLMKLLLLSLAMGGLGNGTAQSVNPLAMSASPKSRAETASNAVYGKGIYVKVDGRGRIITSSDGIAWNISNLEIKTFLRNATYANGLFVVVGGSYVDEPGVLLTSRDGVTWFRRKIPVRANLYGVAYGNGLFVAVGDNDTILTSTNGVVWKMRKTNTRDVLLSAVAYGGGSFLAVGDSGTILASTNGIDWYRRSSGVSMYLGEVHYDDDGFVTQGAEGTTLSSKDGIAWNNWIVPPKNSNRWGKIR
jgi:hypothetical protein